jgi:hypothetical protein
MKINNRYVTEKGYKAVFKILLHKGHSWEDISILHSIWYSVISIQYFLIKGLLSLTAEFRSLQSYHLNVKFIPFIVFFILVFKSLVLQRHIKWTFHCIYFLSCFTAKSFNLYHKYQVFRMNIKIIIVSMSELHKIVTM